MQDQITLERIKLLHPALRNEVMDIYEEICNGLTANVMCRFTHTLRTFAEQDALFAKGRTKPGPRVTNARSGSSWHNYGMAIDIVLLVDKNNDGVFESVSWDVKADFDKDGKADWMEIVRIFKEYGWEWGGDWRFYDAPHFQKTLGQTIKGMLNKHINGKVDKNGFVIL
jgi:peptidoglycan L-alanyl-D-glutamate endopeptidase CwlK